MSKSKGAVITTEVAVDAKAYAGPGPSVEIEVDQGSARKLYRASSWLTQTVADSGCTGSVIESIRYIDVMKGVHDV